MKANGYIEARIKYLSLYELDETDTDAKVFQQRGRHMKRQVQTGISAAKRLALQQERLQKKKEKEKEKRALELKSERELKSFKKETKKTKNKTSSSCELKVDSVIACEDREQNDEMQQEVEVSYFSPPDNMLYLILNICLST